MKLLYNEEALFSTKTKLLNFNITLSLAKITTLRIRGLLFRRYLQYTNTFVSASSWSLTKSNSLELCLSKWVLVPVPLPRKRYSLYLTVREIWFSRYQTSSLPIEFCCYHCLDALWYWWVEFMSPYW